MKGSGDVKGAFDGANHNFSMVRHYLLGSGEAADEHVMRLIGGLYDVADPLLELWRTVTGVKSAALNAARLASGISEIRGLLFRAGRMLSANVEGTSMDAHLSGSANTLDALINLLAQATGPAARSAVLIRKEAIMTQQTAQHRYALALRAPDTAVESERSAAHHPGRVELTRRLHRGVVDMTVGVEAWTR